jgi:hypothetical protein
MINKDKLIADCLAVQGWPYVSPGSNDERGIDCSGMLVRAYRLQGGTIYHGSNRIVRAYCKGVVEIRSESDLVPGMAVFKWRNDGEEADAYKANGVYYDARFLGNFYHVGLVAQVKPTRIVHATMPMAKVDTALGSWTHAGYLRDVDYEGVATDTNGAQGIYLATAATGTSINMRSKPSTATDNRIAVIPIGDYIEVTKIEDGWAFAKWHDKSGYIQKQYLTLAKEDAEDTQEGGDGDKQDEDLMSISLPRYVVRALYNALEVEEVE